LKINVIEIDRRHCILRPENKVSINFTQNCANRIYIARDASINTHLAENINSSIISEFDFTN